MKYSGVVLMLTGLALCVPTSGPFAADAGAGKTPSSPRKHTEIARIKHMEAGDVACYVTLAYANGKEADSLADFSLCEDRKVLGKRVAITRQKMNVMADSCQGNPDCPDTEVVDLITKVRVLSR